MKSSLLRTREKIRQQREAAEATIRLRGNLEAANYQLRNARNEVERLKNRLGRLTSNRIEMNPMTRSVTLCVSIDQMTLELNEDEAITDALRYLEYGLRNWRAGR